MLTVFAALVSGAFTLGFLALAGKPFMQVWDMQDRNRDDLAACMSSGYHKNHKEN